MKVYLERYPSNISAQPILTPRPTVPWEAKAVFNPCVIQENGVFHMLYRTYPEVTGLGEPRLKRPGYYLTHQQSFIGYASSTDGIHFERRDTPFIAPDQPFDAYGCEDPRVTKFGDTYYITYTAIDGPLDEKYTWPGVRIALATSKDFQTITKHGIIGPAETSKAAAVFPETVFGGKIALAMTINSDTQNSHVSVRYYQSFDELLHPTQKSWESFLVTSRETAVLKTSWWLNRGPELGAPPIKTGSGWLFLYSTEAMSHTWTISAALTDLHEPHRLIARTPGFLLQPVTAYERDGLVPEVTFPSGAVVVGEDLFVYYGAADTVIGLATCKLRDLLSYLEECKGK